ncbi:MAG TPA: glycosyltransferase family 1 protein [Vicinamibacterales bacterium]
MRILVDYRPALRERTGVGEYVHQLVRAYSAAYPGEVAVFTSSWKDRPPPTVSSQLRASVIDRRIPVRVLNLLWHRVGWPSVETVAGPFDLVHSAHPLLIPARRAAQVVTIHDLFFLTNAAQTRAEIRRDYPALAGVHARRAHAVITSTHHGKRLIAARLGVPEERIYVCPPGAPSWTSLGQAPNVPHDGYLLFIGTLEPRKNVGGLLDAYEVLLGRMRAAPMLVIAGRATAAAHEWLSRIDRPPLAGQVRYHGYVADEDRERLYAGARLLVLPSLDEGFGLPALEAMAAGVPVVASNRGSLPEVVGSAGALVDPSDIGALSAALERFVSDDTAAVQAGAAGLVRARAFTWGATAATLRRAYGDAIVRRRNQ